MLTLKMNQLTQPESLSDAELREILENRCIDFSNYKNLSRCELIELYKRVALPLPQRKSESNQDLDINTNNGERNSINESYDSTLLLNGKGDRELDPNKITRISQLSNKRSTSEEEHSSKSTSKDIYLNNSSNITKCSTPGKNNNNEKLDEAPPRKRQKITWP